MVLGAGGSPGGRSGLRWGRTVREECEALKMGTGGCVQEADVFTGLELRGQPRWRYRFGSQLIRR